MWGHLQWEVLMLLPFQYAGGTTQFGECLAEYVQERSECTPWNVDGCAVTLNVTLNESFVDATLRLHNGSYVIATKAQVRYLGSGRT